MIRYLIHRPTTDGKVYAVISGLSTDTKPTAGIITGSRFVAVDTGAGYLFDETSGEWNENQQFSEAVAAYIGIVVNGNKATLSAAIGQFIVLRNSTISGCTDGLYTAAKEIQADTAIDNTYLTAVSGGGLNALLGIIPEQLIHLGTETDYPLSAAHTAYPMGITLIYTVASTSYPYGTGTVVTIRSANARGVQFSFGNSSNSYKLRTADYNGWSEWKTYTGS